MQSYMHKFAGSKRSWLPEPNPDDVELSAKRCRNDERHQSRWGSIIDRYSHDFTDCGDEIDLQTGTVVVNKGHLERMRDEFDIGNGTPASPRRRINVLSQVVSLCSSDVEDEDEEDVDAEEDDSRSEDASLGAEDDEEEEPVEDELNSTPDRPDSQQYRRRSPEVRIRSRSPSVEPQFVDEVHIFRETDEPVATVETPDHPIPQLDPAVLPQFQVPQPGFGGQLDTAAMQAMSAAMSTAMGTAIQAQMMAFMNVFLASRQDISATSNTLPLPATAMATAQSLNPNGLAAQLERPEPTRQVVASRNDIQPSTLHREERQTMSCPRAQDSIDLSRAKTPGSGSLWALPSRRKVGRPKGGSSLNPSRLARTAGPTPQSPIRRAPGRPPNSRSAHANVNSNNRDSAEVLRWQGTASSPSQAITKPVGTASSSNNTASVPKRQRGRPRKADRSPLNAQDPSDQGAGLVNYEVSGQPLLGGPSIVDSDEDEISAITPSSSARKASSVTVPGHIPSPLRKSHLSMTNNIQSTPFLHRTPSLSQGSDTQAYPERSSLPKSRLRNRRTTLNYNEKAAFTDLLEDINSDDDSYHTTKPQKNHMQARWLNKQNEEESDSSVDRHPAVKIVSNKLLANISLPRSQPKPRPSLASHEISATMSEAELVARYEALTNRDRVNKLEYKDRPPALPCAHCRTTAASAWLHNPEGGIRRICNACHGYMQRHDGEKRPVMLEEFRSLKHKIPCDNCSDLAVRDWHGEAGGKRLCRKCKTHTKLNDGAMRPVPKPTLKKCERCKSQVTKVFCLSNIARVCLDCHNDIFADYDPNNDPYYFTSNAKEQKSEDLGETFFDRCSLIYSYNMLPGVPYTNTRSKYEQNVGGMPCKTCHSLTASGWRPALGGSMICEVCYVRINKFIAEYHLRDRLGEHGTMHIDGVKTEGFKCEKCEEPIVSVKWRCSEEAGIILCTGCSSQSHSKKTTSATS
jgi:hypothetical protein